MIGTMEKKGVFYEIENESGLNMSVQKTYDETDSGELHPDGSFALLIEDLDFKADISKNGDLVVLLSRDNLKGLLRALIELT